MTSSLHYAASSWRVQLVFTMCSLFLPCAAGSYRVQLVLTVCSWFIPCAAGFYSEQLVHTVCSWFFSFSDAPYRHLRSFSKYVSHILLAASWISGRTVARSGFTVAVSLVSLFARLTLKISSSA